MTAIITKAAIEITIDKNGKFLSASAVNKGDEKTVFPVTEDSAGRTSKPIAHPLCDQLQYLIPPGKNDQYSKREAGDIDKYNLYINQISQWASSSYSHPSVCAVLKYVEKGTIFTDLSEAGLIKYDKAGVFKNGKDFVRWIVNGIGEDSGPCWTNRKLQKAFIFWYHSIQSNEVDYCMVTSEISVPAKQHAKGVVALSGNAKLISSNDTNGFTYRGRFITDHEALSIGYESSQKQNW